MSLSQAQRTLYEKAKSSGSGGQATALDDEVCTYVIANIVRDLGFDHAFPKLTDCLPHFFSPPPLVRLRILGLDPLHLFERLIELNPDSDTYFASLASLHKARMKYETILSTQPISSLDQVGPRVLLQHGSLGADALTSLLVWRKWIFDIDNRAGQETGYLFEPIIANSLGGVSLSARNSPVKRVDDNSKGRQVDCLKGTDAYEIKIRVTIAASGQGRWAEELQFPRDASASGYRPVLLVLDPTSNPKLNELVRAYADVGGRSYVGGDAWEHMDGEAGPTMARFLDLYVRGPIESLSDSSAAEPLPITFRRSPDGIEVDLAGEKLQIRRFEGASA